MPRVARKISRAARSNGRARYDSHNQVLDKTYGALADLRRSIESVAPADGHYEHNARWGDGNGFSHVRSALLKTALALPIVDGRLRLGTWQQVVVLNFDNRPREREVVAVIYGSADPA